MVNQILTSQPNLDIRMKMAEAKLVKVVRGYTLISWTTTFTWNHVVLILASLATPKPLAW